MKRQYVQKTGGKIMQNRDVKIVAKKVAIIY